MLPLWSFDLTSLSPHTLFCSLKGIIAVKSDYRMNQALQRTDAVLAAPKVLLVFDGDVLYYVCKTREAGVALSYRFVRLLRFSCAE